MRKCDKYALLLNSNQQIIYIYYILKYLAIFKAISQVYIKFGARSVGKSGVVDLGFWCSRMLESAIYFSYEEPVQSFLSNQELPSHNTTSATSRMSLKFSAAHSSRIKKPTKPPAFKRHSSSASPYSLPRRKPLQRSTTKPEQADDEDEVSPNPSKYLQLTD
jgi:hypothetical protein